MLEIDCPFCGKRPESEFWCVGEGTALLPTLDMTDEALQAHLYFRDNPSGLLTERWVHRYGCAEWLIVTRDSRDNRIAAVGFAYTGVQPEETSS